MTKHYIDRDKIMNKKEFYKLPLNDRKALMNHWRLVYDTETIKRELGISTTAFYSLLKRLGLPTDLRKYRDEQPSILGEDKPKQIESKMHSNQPTSPSKTFEVEVGVTGRVDVNELPSVLEFAKEHHLELTLNATK